MSNYIRDKFSGALIISNPEKEREIRFRRTVEDEIKALKEEINTLKKTIQDLLVERN